MNIRDFAGTITEPGIYRHVPMSAYHGPALCDGPSISSSGLRKIFGLSAAHYWDTSPYNDDADEDDEKKALILGRAAHHLLLGEADFGKHFVVRPEKFDGKDWNSNRGDCKAWLAARAEEGRAVLTAAMRDQVKGMARGLARHPMVGDPKGVRLLDGLIEHTLVWRDADTGVWLKFRPDAIPMSSDDVADLKTAADITDRGLSKAIASFGLNMQGGLGRMAWRETIGREMASFSLVFIESKRPHLSKVKTLKPADLDDGEAQCRIAIKAFAHGMETGHWPGPGGDQTDAEYIDIEDWDRKRARDRLEALAKEIAA